jgi:monofunctional biosynthetic peptidoglycan transglycosylase
MRLITDFKESDGVRWRIINDGVMGGRSSSDLELTESGTVLFSGFLSLENNGGFASVRGSLPAMDLSAFQGVVLRVRGDGRRYQLRFRTDTSFDGMAYRGEFETTPGEWSEIKLAFQDFQPTFRGRIPRGVGPLDPGRIRQMGFLIGDKKEGPFELEIAWIKAYSAADGEGPE